MGNERNKRNAKLAGAGAIATTVAAGYLAKSSDESQVKKVRKKIRKRSEIKRAARKVDVKAGQNQLAKMQLRELQNINAKDLNLKNRKIHKELINRQKDIIKGTKPTTLTKTAAKIGLKSIPGVGAFITAFSSKPAGQGSALTGPGSKKK